MRSLCPEDYTIGWICALPIELAASMTMLDEEHLALPANLSDPNIYTLGRLGQHNIVMACLPAGLPGTSSAASAAATMRIRFPSIRFGLMVGIGGGAPAPSKDIRLGDVVVSEPGNKSGGVVQYDFGKTVEEGKFVRTGSLNAPPTVLLNAINWLRAKHMLNTNEIVQHLDAVPPRFAYPGRAQDQLFESIYDHQAGATCANCDIQRLVERSPRATSNPIVHYGIIASANSVMKHGPTRDKLGKEINAICFEMESAGLMNTFPCLVIRGISDYADSHRNKIWQPYAALTAAAYAKELLCAIPIPVQKPRSTLLDPGSNPLYLDHEPSEEIYDFSRGEILDGTLDWLLKDKYITRALTSTTAEKQMVCIRGPPRSGKSCAASYLIDYVRQRNDGKSTVIYYFFSAVRGMTSARDAVNAIRYQLQNEFDTLQDGSVPRHVSGYNPTGKPTPGMLRLLKKGLEPYLTQSKVNVYLIIDGIDEADFRTRDPVAHNKSEMEIFLRYLYDIKSARNRVILIGRPLQMLDQYIPNLTYSNLDFEDSSRAIDYYVGQFIKDRPHLQEMFHETGIVPVEYFRVNGNGVFTWAQNALSELSTVKCFSRFQQLITNLPKDYSLLYDANARLFSNMNDEDKEWIKEIIYRLDLSRKPLMLLVLRRMVDASLSRESYRFQFWRDSSRDQFVKFLAVQCASFLRIESTRGVIVADMVRFRHRSFQSFIHSDLGKDELNFDPQEISTREALMALRKLIQHSKHPEKLEIDDVSWADHLPKAATRGEKATELLVCMCDVFSSASVIEWLINLARSVDGIEELPLSTILMNSLPAVEKALTNITDWARACRMDSTAEARIGESEVAKINTTKPLLSNRCSIGNFLGKLAASIALDRPFPTCCSRTDVKVMFGLAFRYYCRRTDLGNVLRELIEGDFNGMIQWLGLDLRPKASNLGCIFSLVQQWNSAITWYKIALQEDKDYNLNICLAQEHEQGNYLDAVTQYKAAIENGLPYHYGCVYAADTYRNAGDLNGFVQFAQDVELNDHLEPTNYGGKQYSIMSVYMAAGDYDGAIQAFDDPDEIHNLLEAYEKVSYRDESTIDTLEQLMKFELKYGSPRYVDLLYHFSNACQVHGYVDKAIEVLRNETERERCTAYYYVNPRLYLADLYMKSGRADDAIDVLREVFIKYPDSVRTWAKLFDLLLSIHRLDDVFRWVERLCSTEKVKNSPAWFSCFYSGCGAKGRALEQKGDLNSAITVYESAIRSNPVFWKLWGHLCEVHDIKKNTRTGVAISRELLERLKEDRKYDVSENRRKQFGNDFLGNKIGATEERLALWYGLVHVLEVVWMEKHCTMSDSAGWTALHIVAYGGYEDMVGFILSRGQCDPTLTDRNGRTPLHIAAMEGQLKVVTQLLDFGVNAGAKDVLGFTALNLAIEAGERDVVKILTRF